MKLTPTMRMALAEIERRPGTPADDLPGGDRTVGALMRRGLVEVEGKQWKTYLPEHKHEFHRGMHLDGCHYFRDEGRCECGTQYATYIERNLAFDPYSAIWMEPTGEEPCERCEQLMNGARPRTAVVIARREHVHN